jgi:hypothetical protein
MGATKDVQPVHQDAPKLDSNSGVPDTKNVQPSNGPLQRLRDAIPSFRGWGRGKG